RRVQPGDHVSWRFKLRQRRKGRVVLRLKSLEDCWRGKRFAGIDQNQVQAWQLHGLKFLTRATRYEWPRRDAHRNIGSQLTGKRAQFLLVQIELPELREQNGCRRSVT